MSTSIVVGRDCDVNDLIRRTSPLVDKVPDAEAQLRRWLRMSEQVWVGMHDDKVACVWGIAPTTTISNRVYLWLLTTDIVDQHKFIFIRRSQIVIKEVLKDYEYIVGHVEVGNDRARKWLRWLGADIGPPVNGSSPFVIRRR